MKTLLAILLLIPSLSWAHEETGLIWNNDMSYCIETEEYKKWYKKNKKKLDKQNVEFHKCVLEHSKKESNLDQEVIFGACSVVSEDKYKTKGEEPPQYKHKYHNNEFGSERICHSH